MAISAVIFDAFGTTLRIGNPTPPYRQLLHEGAKHGRRPHPGDLHRLMAIDVGFQGAADLLGSVRNPKKPNRRPSNAKIL